METSAHSSMNSVWKAHIKPVLKGIRSQVIGEDWRYQIKPIAWYNSISWISHTISEDRKYYQSKSRPWTLGRLSGMVKPNLKAPIFIVGAPRSGTTFLGECIGEIPEISYHFEPVLTKAATRYIYGALWDKTKAQKFFKRVYGGLMRLHGDGDLQFAEKTPQASLIIPFLYETFPDAKFVHIIRDGRDSSISLAQKPWYRNDRHGSGAKEPGGYPFGPKARFWVEPERTQEFETTNDIHRCIWLWRRYMETIFEATAKLRPEQLHELRYENLVNHPQEESEKLVEFLGIKSPTSREVFINTVVTKASPNSVGRWTTELSEQQHAEAEQESGTWLRQLGYLN